MRIRMISVCLSIAMFACSGGGASIDGDPEGGSGPANDGGGPSNPLDDGGDATTSPDGAKVDAGADDRIDPIELGRSWTYDVTILGTYPLCKAGSHTGQVLGQKVVGGKNAFQVQSFCPGAGTSSYAVTGDRVEVYYANTWVLSLDAPVEEGHSWTDGLNTYAWEKVGQLTVPAGTFEDCWKAKHQTSASYTTFCRGVGPVRWHFVDGTGNGYDATLTAHGS